ELPVNSSTLSMLATLNGLRAEARSTVMVAVCAQALTPTLSQRERESNRTTIRFPLLSTGVLFDSLLAVPPLHN
ncbi:MAG: hypothetical protein QOI77_922, partial [Blastocatellia bacterium]|nr:hypothetical protein [Blastocatellia bacterium]